MIGVIANSSQHNAVREFFELFKTPWEFCCGDRDYEVLICADDGAVPNSLAKLIVIYSSHKVPIDSLDMIQINTKLRGNRILLGQGMRIPLYGDSATFAYDGACILQDEESRQAAAYVASAAHGRTVVRIGYDLFDEVAVLLTEGQPCANASIPSLDFHISVLRNLIVRSGLPFVEIPPVPNGYRFIACLTHDVDHPSIRLHMLDRTMFGFLYRAVIASFLAVLRGRASLRTLLTNWAAALKLPFIYLGLAEDFWNQLDAYTRLEGRARSSFFVIPFKGRPGTNGEKSAPAQRASGYSANNIASEVRQLQSEGHEIGLHGIDAWHDSSKARAEVEEIRQITGTREVGVRMHWLYFDKQSPAVLEAAGVDYDSTVGYNEAVGYRAGTAQVYKPLEATKLLELPLHIMDTALFFPGRQNLSRAEAGKLVNAIIEHAVLLGGVVTVNWHDRSIAPERLWGDFYSTLLEECDKKGAWLANAGETVRWFRERRAARFDEVDSGASAQPFNASDDAGKRLPGLFLRVHSAGDQSLRTDDMSYSSNAACTQSEAADTMVQRG
jgi:peptidoglycan/xylan/chitin deacetylase (PgdA/CDA1 family)